jgi:cbb3-type cytochrome oxidase maturation protein
MEVVFSLVGISVLLVLLVAVALIWSVRSGQFEDLEGPAWRMIMDDDDDVRPPGETAPEDTAASASSARAEEPGEEDPERRG